MGVGAGFGFASDAEACWPGAVPPPQTKTKLINKTIRSIGATLVRIVKAEFPLSAVHSVTPGSSPGNTYRVSTLTEVEAAADALPDEQKEQLLAFLAAKLGRSLDSIGSQRQASPRSAGLHAGAWELADDFDALNFMRSTDQ